VTEIMLIEHCPVHLASYNKPMSADFLAHVPRVGPVIDYDALDARLGGGDYLGTG